MPPTPPGRGSLRAQILARFGGKFGLASGANLGSLRAQTARVLAVQGGGLIGAVSGYSFFWPA